jgi:hypothetical protein
MTEAKELAKEVHTERIFVNAEMARRWIRLNIENNRPINQQRVMQYARDMRTGKWHENGDTIKFAVGGELIDGQHRLLACIDCGIGFWSLVAYGVKKEAFVTIDRHQARTVGQVLHLSTGISNYGHLAGALSWLYRFRDGIVLPLTSARPTSGELAELFAEHPGMAESVKVAVSTNTRFRFGSVGAMAMCHYTFSRQDATLCEAFFDALAVGAGLREIDPVFRLRERIIASQAKRLPVYDLIALTFKAWNAEKEQRTMGGVLRWQVGESFPNIGPIAERKMRPEQKAAHVPKKSARLKPGSAYKAAPTPSPANGNGVVTKLDQLLAKATAMSLDHAARK